MASVTRVARYTAQLVIMVEPDVKDQIVGEAKARGVSHSVIAREWLERGRPVAQVPADPFAPIERIPTPDELPSGIARKQGIDLNAPAEQRRRGLAEVLKRP